MTISCFRQCVICVSSSCQILGPFKDDGLQRGTERKSAERDGIDRVDVIQGKYEEDEEEAT